MVLRSFGASADEVAELLVYNRSPFDHARLPQPLTFPLTPEPYVAAWEGYAREAEQLGGFEALRRRLPQLSFPIEAGISQTDGYRAATLRGVPIDTISSASGLALARPDELQIRIHRSLAGPVPVLIPAGRTDFVALVRALSMRNEPLLVPDSQGAATVRGFNNWDRIRSYREQWQQQSPERASDEAWAEEFRRLIPQTELYRDHFIILSDGPYSAVGAAEMGMPAGEWNAASLAIRSEHECTHTLTLRLYAVSRNNALDELFCDYMGIVAYAGRFRSDWLNRFMGLEAYPGYREGGRLQNYLGDPPLSAGAFAVLQSLVHAAAEQLDRFDRAQFGDGEGPMARGTALTSIVEMTLEELATDGLQ